MRAVAPRYGAIVASVFVRATSGSGRLDLAAGARAAAARSRAIRPSARARRSSRSSSAIRTPRRSCRSCRRCCSRTISTICPSSPPCARSPAKRRSAAGCRSRCRRGQGWSAIGATGPVLDADRPQRPSIMLRDKLLARLAEMGDAPDHQRARGRGSRHSRHAAGARAPARRAGARARGSPGRCGGAPASGSAATRRRRPACTCLRDADGARALRRQGGEPAATAPRAFRRAAVARAEAGDVAGGRRRVARGRLGGRGAAARGGADCGAAAAGRTCRSARRTLDARACRARCCATSSSCVPSVEADSVELVAARPTARWLIQRTRRNGADLAVHTHAARGGSFDSRAPIGAATTGAPLAPIVYSWLSHRGASATRLDPHDAASARVLRTRLASLLADDRSVRRAS